MNLEPIDLDEARPLFEQFHAYKSASKVAVYCFGVREQGRLVAAFSWQPPAPGAAISISPTAHYAVLALSRMVAIPKAERLLKHISKPLKAQMRDLIDRTRWPVLVTYSDEGLGHNGFVYQCSGWEKTTRRRVRQFVNGEGQRTSPYNNGKMITGHLDAIGAAFIQRWENWACAREEVADWLPAHGWVREKIPGRVWRSGNDAYRWVKR